MENATKALLIAAAILIAILIISLSLVVYRMAADTVGSVNLSEAEIAEFNGKFEASAGTRVSGASVNGLLSTVLTNNLQAQNNDTGNPMIEIDRDGTSGAAVTLSGSGLSGTITKVNTGLYYKVTLRYNADGLVYKIRIDNI